MPTADRGDHPGNPDGEGVDGDSMVPWASSPGHRQFGCQAGVLRGAPGCPESTTTSRGQAGQIQKRAWSGPSASWSPVPLSAETEKREGSSIGVAEDQNAD